MICQRCLFRTASSALRKSSTHRTISSSASRSAIPASQDATTQAKPRQASDTPAHSLPSATSTSAAQPFSTPLTPASEGQGNGATPPIRIVSSIKAGTPLTGLNFIKGQQDPVAKEDHEYPDWLWRVLGSQKEGGKGEEAGDLFSKSKKQRRIAAKRLRKEALMNPDALAPKIPIYEQTIDLPAGDGSVQSAMQAEAAREDLTKAMRQKRRSKIKEDNFLTSMR